MQVTNKCKKPGRSQSDKTEDENMCICIHFFCNQIRWSGYNEISLLPKRRDFSLSSSVWLINFECKKKIDCQPNVFKHRNQSSVRQVSVGIVEIPIKKELKHDIIMTKTFKIFTNKFFCYAWCKQQCNLLFSVYTVQRTTDMQHLTGHILYELFLLGSFLNG